MNALAALANRISSALMRNRNRLPRPVNRLIDDVATNPDGLPSRLASLLLGGASAKQVPAATAVPDTDIRVYIGPTNYAGQGYLWARALEADSSGTGAKNMAVELPGGFDFAADTSVPIAVYNASHAWQQSEFEAVTRFSHVLFEAERPLFGRLMGRDVAREVQALQQAGVSCAFLSHGTDIRSPRTHLELNRWSPFADDPQRTRVLQKDADSNLRLLMSLELPVFVATPDLLIDAPWAVWCPVVIDVDRWPVGTELLSRPRPIVTHIPSVGAVKGTHLIEPTLRKLHDSGVIEYRRATGVPSAEMPQLIGASDIVLDQFRLGSYGVAACEAMAAGRIVIGHVLPQVRDRVREQAGQDLPIFEADADNLEVRLRELIQDPETMLETATRGREFVRSLHSGRYSSRALREHWIDASTTGGAAAASDH